MRRGRLYVRNLGTAVAALMLCAATACVSDSHAGIPLTAGAADPVLQELARRAQAGNKHAQLELGIRYEEGRGVPVDLGQATERYGSAASETGRIIHVYSPIVGKNGQSRVIAINRGPSHPGLAHARVQLQPLRQSRAGKAEESWDR